MKRYVLAATALATAFVALFLLVAALRVPLLSDPSPWLQRGGAPAAALSFVLLVADVALPVPSSILMIANGALFGVARGAALSLAAGTAATLVAFAVGRRGGPLLQRFVPASERASADAFLARWGALAVALSRPVPVLAETVAILAGASPLGWGRVAMGGAAGTLPVAVFYAATGALAATTASLLAAFAIVIAATAAAWGAARWWSRRAARAEGAG